MTDMSEVRQTLRITALPVADLARILAAAYRRQIQEDHVREIAEAAGLIRPDGTINLLEYTAYLVQEMGHGSD
jgi:hypothetical protein